MLIKDKDGNKIGAENQETGLLNILFAKQADGSYKNPGKNYNDFSPLEKIISNHIMSESGISYYYENPNQTGIQKAKWNVDGKALDMNLVMGYAGDSIATAVFMNYFDKTTNSMIDGQTSIPSVVAAYKDSGYLNRLMNYFGAKNTFYSSMQNEISKFNNLSSTDEYLYGPDVDRVGESDSFHKGYDKNIKYKNLNMQFSGKLTEIDPTGLPIGTWQNTSGKNVNYEIGFMFENLFVSTGIQHNTFHLDSVSSSLKNKNYYSAGTNIGVSGNTGFSKGAHVHTELSIGKSFSNAYYSSNIQNYFLIRNSIPGISNYTSDPKKWNNTMNFYSNKYDKIYLNTSKMWRIN